MVEHEDDEIHITIRRDRFTGKFEFGYSHGRTGGVGGGSEDPRMAVLDTITYWWQAVNHRVHEARQAHREEQAARKEELARLLGDGPLL